MNALTIADALATKYIPANITPPSGRANIRQSTARIPNNVNSSPWVNVILPSGDSVLGSGVVDYHLDYHVLFMFAKHTADTARDMAALLDWLGILLVATYADMDLGVTGVKKAYPVAFQLTTETYGGAEFYGWDITVRVDFQEPQAFAA